MGNAGSVPAVYDEPGYGIVSMLIVLTTFSVSARLYARSLQRAKISTDDYMVVLAYILNLALLIVNLLEIHHGKFSLIKLTKMAKNPHDMKYFTNLRFADAVFGVLAIIAVRLSVLFMYRRIFTPGERWFRIGWWFNFLLIMPCYTAYTFTVLGLQTGKPNGFDGETLARISVPIIGAINVVSDALILALPIGMIWRLNLSKREKFSVIGLFSLGIIATSISIMRVARFQVRKDHHWNRAYALYNDTILTTTESSTGLICVCLMVIKPLLRKVRDLSTTSSKTFISTTTSEGSWRARQSLHSDSERSVGVSEIPRRQNGIVRIHQYNIDSRPMQPGVSQADMQMQQIHPWEGR